MAATATEAPAATSRRLVTLGVLTGTALAALEATVVGAAMPTVIASVGGLHHYSWVFAAYLVTSTVSVPVWGNQGVLGAGATGTGAALMPLMLGWVTFSVIGGRLLLRIGYRPTAIAGMALLTTGFVLLGLGDAASSRAAFYAQLALVGAGLGLSMLTLLLAVQQSVPRTQLGLATSVNQLARSVGGAVGVAVMGVLLAAGLGADVDPAALIVPEGVAAPDPAARAAVQAALGDALGRVFLLSAALCALGLLVIVAWLPGGGAPSEEECCPETGERMVAAEMATLDAEHEPEAVMSDR